MHHKLKLANFALKSMEVLAEVPQISRTLWIDRRFDVLIFYPIRAILTSISSEEPDQHEYIWNGNKKRSLGDKKTKFATEADLVA